MPTQKMLENEVKEAVAAFEKEVDKPFPAAFPRGTVFAMKSFRVCIVGQAEGSEMISREQGSYLFQNFPAFCNYQGNAWLYLPIWTKMYPIYTFTE